MQRTALLLSLLALLALRAASVHTTSQSTQINIDEPAASASESVAAMLNSALYNPDLLQEPAVGPSTNSTKAAKKRQTMHEQLAQVKKCFPVVFNATLPKVIDRTNFPKFKSKSPRFRFHCQQTQQPKNFYTVLEPTFLSSYNIDGFYLPEWVAFTIRRPVFGVSFVKGHTREQCLKKGGGRFFPIHSNNIVTPDAAFTMNYNLMLMDAGKDAREGIQKGQACLPTFFLTCAEKEGTYAMTNVIPMNRYLYTVNLAEADKALRKYVAEFVDVPDPHDPLHDLVASNKYNPLHVVVGPHFTDPKVDYFDWVYAQEDINSLQDVKKAPIPQAVWYAVLDAGKLETAPEIATVAWYCNNRPRGPWPVKGENMYDNGPKLCRVMSLDQLEQIVGVRPFPDLPKAVTSAKPKPAIWHLLDRF